jgi:hypothetical protein
MTGMFSAGAGHPLPKRCDGEPHLDVMVAQELLADIQQVVGPQSQPWGRRHVVRCAEGLDKPFGCVMLALHRGSTAGAAYVERHAAADLYNWHA